MLINSKKLMMLVLVITTIASVTIFAQEPDIEYDPSIHFYEDGIGLGVMHRNVNIGTLSSVVDGRTVTWTVTQFQTRSSTLLQAVEAGSLRFPWGSKNTAPSVSRVRRWSCGGGDDHWVDFHYVPETELWSNDIAVGSWDLGSNNYIRFFSRGLDGGYYCVGGSCTISVCASGQIHNPHRIKISWN